MIFIDSNIPMYLIGAEHPRKRETTIILERLVSEKNKLVTSVEVFQEILHRYVAINKREAIQPAFDAMHGFVDEIFEVTEKDTEEAKALVLSYQGLSARDALHAASMKRAKMKMIFTFDKGFDQLPSIERIPKEP